MHFTPPGGWFTCLPAGRGIHLFFLIRFIRFLYAGYMVLLLLFIVGLFVGSFLNLLADRLPKGEDVIRGRSHCEYCKHTLLWYELIPPLSFFMQKGKSRCCHKKLSLQYPVSELATGFGFVLIYCFQQSTMFNQNSIPLSIFHIQLPFSIFQILFSLVLFFSFLVIFLADLKYEIIPMEMIIVGFFSALGLHFINFTNFTNFFLSSLGAGLFFFCLWYFSKGKAMGDGDIYLAALIGFFLGFPNVIISLYTSFLTGALVGIILVLGGKKSLKAHIPFGPFLILGIGITLLWGDTILRMWRLLW